MKEKINWLMDLEFWQLRSLLNISYFFNVLTITVLVISARVIIDYNGFLPASLHFGFILIGLFPIFWACLIHYCYTRKIFGGEYDKEKRY